jgi:hypothetical protein
MSLSQNRIEEILLTKLLTTISFSNYFTVNIEKDEILGIYIYGSRLWEVDNEDSDLDYVVIVSDDSKIWEHQVLDKFEEKGHILKESIEKTIDLHILSESKYKELVNNADELGLSIYYQNNPILEYNYNLDFENDETKLHNFLVNLRKSFSTKANNSYVKSKKKLTVEERNDFNLLLSIKSIFHSIRILDFGYLIAKFEIEKFKNNKLIFDFSNLTNAHNDKLDKMFVLFEDNNNDWDEIHKLIKPVFNEFSSTFKKIAPKK